ncbi:hypothetical protein Afe04nite_37340 [Asanoa ferruginea]|nr:hypothetical protein Afe04nite_37340 [Asanoa ferruginea]
MAHPARRPPPGQRRSTLRVVGDPVADIVAQFGASVAEKLGRGGEDEDQLRAPFERLLRDMARNMGLRAVPYGEVRLKSVRARPDFAVDMAGGRVGYIELKAPGHGTPSTWRRARRSDRDQWEKLKALPNLLYSDGITWARYSYGELASPVVELEGDLRDRRRRLEMSGTAFETLITDFLTWKPDQPRSLTQLIGIVAGLCRLLRDEVAAILTDPARDLAHEELTLLADDWRDLLFPDLDDIGFADAYAQTVTFALLLARIDGVSFDETPLHEIARLLGKKHSLMGRALAVLTDSEATDELRMLTTLIRVIGRVDWALLEGNTDVHADLYERFLASYDPDLRRRSGSYYTPQPVAGAVVNFVDDVLRTRFDRSWGFAADDVVVVDPAMGTGTFLVEVLRRVAEAAEAKQGRGARAARVRQFFRERLVGFEIQAGPYAVAELRLHEAMRTEFRTELPPSELRFLTDALEDPVRQQGRLRAGYRVIERARQEANRIKRDVPVMVVVGNPPHVENTRGRAPWIESRRKIPVQPGEFPQRPSLDEFRTPGGGRYESDLYGLPWCFWRWALWKAFEAHPDHPQGVVAFITPSSFIKGKSFEGMREYLRRTCDEGWIIELSPEGNRPPQDTRLFGPDVGRQLCVAVFARYSAGDPTAAATVHRVALTGSREAKLAQLESLRPRDERWVSCRADWKAPFLAGGETAWDSYPGLKDLFPESSRGVTTGRTWVYAPDRETLERRWRTFTRARTGDRRRMLPESRDRTVATVVGPLPGFPASERTLADDVGPPLTPVRVAYRAFDRQWLIPDSRLMVMPRPPLWAVRSAEQIYLTEQNSQAIDSGPGVVFTQLIPDLHHYNGRSGRVFPLYCSATRTSPNVTPGLDDILLNAHGSRPSAADLFAYVAAVVAHPSYTRRFATQLQNPGVRVPLTADAGLWREAVALGNDILWLQTFGESRTDPETARPPFRSFVDAHTPKVVAEIPDAEGNLPMDISYDLASRTLVVGTGRIHPVSPEVWDYDVGGMRIVRHWFNYRSADQRYRRRSSVLDDDTSQSWSAELTNELLEIITVLEQLVALESRQSVILNRVCAGPLISFAALTEAAVLPVSPRAHKLTATVDKQPPGLF